MDQQKDDTTGLDGTHEKNLIIIRGQRSKCKKTNKKLNQRFYVQLVGQGRHKRPIGRQRRRSKLHKK